MRKARQIYIPQDISELLDVVIPMASKAPKFLDKTGYLPFINLEHVFLQLTEGLAHNRKALGEERYQTLLSLTAQMRGYFEADPDDTTGDTLKGCKIVHQMEDIIRQVRKPR